MNVPAIKVWNMDYSFIVRNYLNPKLWQKVWTLFAFKDYVITLQLSSINTKKCRIEFEIALKDNASISSFNEVWESVYYSIKSNDVGFLIKSINGTIYRLIKRYEVYYILETLEVYKNAEEQAEIERETLTQIANEFLDSMDVTSDELRELYIDAYVESNAKSCELIGDLRTAYEFHLCPNLYLTFLESIGEKEKYQEVLNHLEANETENVLKEIKEYQKYTETDEYIEEMRAELHAI